MPRQGAQNATDSDWDRRLFEQLSNSLGPVSLESQELPAHRLARSVNSGNFTLGKRILNARITNVQRHSVIFFTVSVLGRCPFRVRLFIPPQTRLTRLHQQAGFFVARVSARTRRAAQVVRAFKSGLLRMATRAPVRPTPVLPQFASARCRFAACSAKAT